MAIVRPEKPEDGRAVRRVNERAFGQEAEANLVDALRRRYDCLISLVAIEEDEVVGYILFSPVTVEAEETCWGAVGLAALAVSCHPNRWASVGRTMRRKRHFLVLELKEGALDGRGGVVKFLPEFEGV